MYCNLFSTQSSKTPQLFVNIIGNIGFMCCNPSEFKFFHFILHSKRLDYLIISNETYLLFLKFYKVMPAAMLYEVHSEWIFGDAYCDIWISIDQFSCTASILNLCLISLDRYWAVTKPFEYSVQRTRKRMIVYIALVWLGAACISLPPLLYFGNKHENNFNGRSICLVSQNIPYQIYATLVSFYIPLPVMLFVYYKIYQTVKRILCDEKRAQMQLEKIWDHSINEENAIDTNSNIYTCSQTPKICWAYFVNQLKASTRLGILMSSFTICWTPFFVLTIVRLYLNRKMSPAIQSISTVFLWLGYVNSLLNPIMCVLMNRDFIKPVREILHCRCANINSTVRNDFYQWQFGEPSTHRTTLYYADTRARGSVQSIKDTDFAKPSTQNQM